MKKLHIDKLVFSLPESVNEMELKDLIFLSELVAQELPIQEIKIKMLLSCLNAHLKAPKESGLYRLKIGKCTHDVNAEDLTAVSSAFDYLFTAPDDEGRCFFDNRLYINHYKEIVIDGIEFVSPGTALEGMTYNQYIYLQVYDQMKDRTPDAIYNFLGCMFLPKFSNHFDPKNLNTEHMKKIPPHVIVLSLWYWIGSCRAIADKFPRIFAGDGESSGNVYDSQQKLLDYIAKADPEKKQKYKEDDLYNILYSLDYLLEIEENKENDV